ncbi:MAG: hypothetical protein KBD46_04085, partial [Candidatus Levybacteria bacterium]|nr:hypothetical protein [Candidatus Levybacteria bacterium]
METAPAPLPTPTTQVSNTGIQSTEIPISELPPEMIKPRSKKKKFIIMGIVAAVIILFVVLVIIMMQLSKPAPKPAPKVVPTPTKAVSTILPVDTSRNDTILVTGVPHFLDMKPSDLPNVYDVRGVFNYKQNLIIVSTSGIVEFDPRTNEIIRQNDSRLFNCMKYATVIGTTLYVSCTQPPGIYGINLENGKLEKAYTGGSTLLSYATVSSVNDTLWVGGKNTVVKINTKDDAMQEYAPKDLGMPDCQYFMVHSYRENTWVTCVSPTIAGVSLYNEKDNTWTPHIPENQTNPIYTLGYNTKK